MNTNNQVVNLAPTRLPYRLSLKEQYGVDESAWRTLVDAIFPSAKSIEAIEMALAYSKARNIDIFMKALHVVPVWSTQAGKMVETVWPGIALHRITATRTKVYAGCDPCQFGPDITRTFKGKIKKNNGWEETEKTVTFPEWGLFTIYKIVGGVRVAFASPRLHWLETYGKMQPSEVPNDRWGNSPHSQFEKCLEAAALRRAFPEELGSELTAEEVDGGMYYGPDLARDITPESTVVPPRPTRGDPAEAERIKAERAADKPTDFVIVDHIGEVAFEGIGPRKFTDEMLKAVKDFYEHGDLKSFETFTDKNAVMVGRLTPLNFGEHEHSILTDYAITFKHLEEKFPAGSEIKMANGSSIQFVGNGGEHGPLISVQDERKPSEPSVPLQNPETPPNGQIQPPAEIHWVALGNKPVTRTNPAEWSEGVIKQINHHRAQRESVQAMWDNLENVETMRLLLRCGGSHQEEAEAVQKAILEKLA